MLSGSAVPNSQPSEKWPVLSDYCTYYSHQWLLVLRDARPPRDMPPYKLGPGPPGLLSLICPCPHRLTGRVYYVHWLSGYGPASCYSANMAVNGNSIGSDDPAFLCPSCYPNNGYFPREPPYHGRSHSKRTHSSQAVGMAGGAPLPKHMALTAHQA